jgi:hypothetical protein
MKIKFTLVIFLLNIFCSYGQVTDTNSIAMLLKPEQIEAFRTQAQKSVNDLARYMETMVDKSNETAKRDKAVSLAVKLFRTEDNIVEVSSVKNPSEKKILKIRVYFNKIKILPYSKVTIKWYDIYLAPHFTKGTDGRYYGVATILQKFEGKTNNELGKYSDITKKNIQIILEKTEYFEGLDKKEKWILKLGDITVVETRNG